MKKRQTHGTQSSPSMEGGYKVRCVETAPSGIAGRPSPEVTREPMVVGAVKNAGEEIASVVGCNVNNANASARTLVANNRNEENYNNICTPNTNNSQIFFVSLHCINNKNKIIMKVINVKGYEGLYCVTEDGKIFSLKRGNELSQLTDKNGYKWVKLSKEGKSKSLYVHDVVLNSFQPKRNDEWVCDHINCDKSDNKLSNLRWLTNRENVSRAKKHNYARGVTFYPKTGHYGAAIQLDGTKYFLGVFDSEEDASNAYQKALYDYEKTGSLPHKRDWSVKYCKGCNRWLPYSEFYAIKSIGHSYLCKECAKEDQRKRRELKKSQSVNNNA